MTSPSSRDIDSANGTAEREASSGDRAAARGDSTSSTSHDIDHANVTAERAGTSGASASTPMSSRGIDGIPGGADVAQCEGAARTASRWRAGHALSTCAAPRRDGGSIDEQVRLPTWRRPHRWITVPAGLAMFLGIWFPVFGDATERVYPITIPPVWPSYVLGLLAALAALTTGRRRSKLVLTAQILVWLMLGATAVVMLGVLVVPGFGDATMAAVFALAIALVLITGIGSFDELAAARVTMSAGFLGAAWFGALRVGQPDPLVGTKLSLFASIGLLVGGLAWRREIVRELRFPRATATVRRV